MVLVEVNKRIYILYGFYLECKENLNENKIDVMVKPIKPHIIKAYPCHPNLIYFRILDMLLCG